MLYSELNIEITDELEGRLLPYISTQISTTMHGRSTLEENWKFWLQLYESGRSIYRNQPWPGSSDIGISIIATAIEAIYARIVNTVLALDPLFIAKPKRSEFVIPCRALQDYIAWASETRWGTYDMVRDASLCMLKLGTAICKVVYTSEVDKIYEYSPEFSDAVLSDPQEISSGPKLIYIPLIDFLIPPGYSTVMSAPWVAHRSQYTSEELDIESTAGRLYNIDKVKEAGEDIKVDPVTEFEEKIDASDGVSKIPQFPIWEWWGRFDIDNDGFPENIVLTYSARANKILHAQYHPYQHNLRPFVPFRYMPRENNFYGIGISEMGEDYQIGVSTMTNQRIDNKTISNTSCFKARKGSGIRPKLKVYPGKVINLNDMSDLEAFPLGSNYNSTTEDEALLRQYFERRTGVSDYSLGRENESVGTKATATATLALIQEGSKRFDLIIRDFRNSLSECGMQCLQLCQQFKPTNEMYMVLGPAGLPIEKVINFPRDYIRSRVSLIVNTSTSATSKEIAKQNDMALFGIISQHQQRVLELIQAMAQAKDPKIQGILAAMLDSLMEIMNRMLDNYDIKNTDRINPNYLEVFSGKGAEQGQAGGVGSPPWMEGAAVLPPGMEGGDQVGLPFGGNGQGAGQVAGQGIYPEPSALPTGGFTGGIQ